MVALLFFLFNSETDGDGLKLGDGSWLAKLKKNGTDTNTTTTSTISNIVFSFHKSADSYA